MSRLTEFLSPAKLVRTSLGLSPRLRLTLTLILAAFLIQSPCFAEGDQPPPPPPYRAASVPAPLSEASRVREEMRPILASIMQTAAPEYAPFHGQKRDAWQTILWRNVQKKLTPNREQTLALLDELKSRMANAGTPEDALGTGLYAARIDLTVEKQIELSMGLHLAMYWVLEHHLLYLEQNERFKDGSTHMLKTVPYLFAGTLSAFLIGALGMTVDLDTALLGLGAGLSSLKFGDHFRRYIQKTNPSDLAADTTANLKAHLESIGVNLTPAAWERLLAGDFSVFECQTPLDPTMLAIQTAQGDSRISTGATTAEPTPDYADELTEALRRTGR